jgi:hypothetical protein
MGDKGYGWLTTKVEKKEKKEKKRNNRHDVEIKRITTLVV